MLNLASPAHTVILPPKPANISEEEWQTWSYEIGRIWSCALAVKERRDQDLAKIALYLKRLSDAHEVKKRQFKSFHNFVQQLGVGKTSDWIDQMKIPNSQAIIPQNTAMDRVADYRVSAETSSGMTSVSRNFLQPVFPNQSRNNP